MLKILDAQFPSDFQFEMVFRGMRRPFKAQDKGDSYVESDWNEESIFCLGEKDLNLARKLIKSGTDHSKFLRQLPVILAIEAPLYWWKQMDKYQIGTVTSSESTMHTLTKKEFEPSDFSLSDEKIEYEDEPMPGSEYDNYYVVTMMPPDAVLNEIIENLNNYRKRFIETGEQKYWTAINQLLPQSYNQTRTWSGNYEVLRNIYFQRKGHRLKEWQSFREFIENEVPFFEDLVEKS